MQKSIHHIAIIMDGNGRWATKRGLPRIKGHEAAAQITRRIVEAAKSKGVEYLTLYAFSTENWNRPKEEIDGLFRLLEHFIDDEVHKLKDSGVCIHIIGDISKFSSTLQDKILMTCEKTSRNSELHLAIAMNYGGRDEIIRVAKKIAQTGLSPEDITEDVIKSYLDTAFMPDPDLLVRTGGEKRISNFLLWQMAYTEMYFCDILWPDFDEKALDDAIAWFSTRERRFGMTSDQIKELF
ncbi:MAG: di-trans,poly-cis-decaprenylcistransferase [Deltaproteobacteria bacterium]|nr:di-trans,poly-cis-decaprenylcistransferase [Deltaproteobacteria bacterium]